MATAGYKPTRDHMLTIVEAARSFYRLAREWRECSELPAYPHDLGGPGAKAALHRMERSLNPKRHPWGSDPRARMNTEAWPDDVVRGLSWLRDLVDIILKRHSLQSMAIAEDYESWRQETGGGPQFLSVTTEELEALRRIMWLLPRVAELPEPVARAPKAPAVAPPSPDPDELLRLRDRHTLSPYVRGRKKDALTPAQFNVLKTLWDAPGHTLTGEQLIHKSGHPSAVRILKQIRGIDPDWASIVIMPKRGGREGYRIGDASSDVQGWAEVGPRLVQARDSEAPNNRDVG